MHERQAGEYALSLIHILHICFLIERLVTKTPIEKYKEIEKFKGEQQEFIRIVNESFRTLLEQYNVKLPDSEIAYLLSLIHISTTLRLTAECSTTELSRIII